MLYTLMRNGLQNSPICYSQNHNITTLIMSTQLHSSHPTGFLYNGYEPVKMSSSQPPPVPAKKNYLRTSQSFNTYDASSHPAPAVPKRVDKGFGTLSKPPMPNPRYVNVWCVHVCVNIHVCVHEFANKHSCICMGVCTFECACLSTVHACVCVSSLVP